MPVGADRIPIGRLRRPAPHTPWAPDHDGVLLYLTLCRLRADLRPAGWRVEPGRTPWSKADHGCACCWVFKDRRASLGGKL